MNAHFAHWPIVIQAIGWTLLHFVWQGGVVGLGYAVARLILPVERSEARYAAGLIALAIMALCPLATFAMEYSQALAMAASALPDAASDVAPIVLAPMLVVQGFELDRLLPWLVLVWTFGVVAMTWRAWHQWCAIERIAKRHAQASPELEQLLGVLARQFGLLRNICVLVSDHIDTPTLIGWLKPVVLLPTAVALGFPRQQLELILAHELGHLRRYDHLVNLAQAVLETLLFYHPVVHWISREVRNEREICCDRLVLRQTRGEPREYARTLASLEEMRLTTPRLAIAATGGVLLDRVRRIVGVPAPRLAATRPTVGLAFLAATTLALIVTLALRPDKFDELAAGANAVLDRVPRPSGLALGGLTLQLSPPPKWAVEVARPIRIALPQAREPAVESAAAARTVAHVEAIPRSSMLGVDSGLRQDRDGQLTSIANIPLSVPKISAIAPVDPARRFSSPIALRSVAPRYPEGAALTAPVRIDVSFAIGADGTVRDTKVATDSADAAFAAAAQHALADWRFDPATVPADTGARFQQTFVFSKEEAKRRSRTAVADELGCTPRTGSLICRRESEEKIALPLTIIRLTDAGSGQASSG